MDKDYITASETLLRIYYWDETRSLLATGDPKGERLSPLVPDTTVELVAAASSLFEPLLLGERVFRLNISSI